MHMLLQKHSCRVRDALNLRDKGLLEDDLYNGGNVLFPCNCPGNRHNGKHCALVLAQEIGFRGTEGVSRVYATSWYQQGITSNTNACDVNVMLQLILLCLSLK